MTKILLMSCSINKIFVIYIFIIYEFLIKTAPINTEIVGYVIFLITFLSIDISLANVILNIHFTYILLLE